MPQVGDIAAPTHSQKRISVWTKHEKPRGEFCRLIWDSDREIHLAVCNPDHNTGIIAFLVGNKPKKGDSLKVISVGKSVCKVASISKTYNAALKAIEIADEEDCVIDDAVMSVMEDKSLVGIDLENADNLTLAETFASIWNDICGILIRKAKNARVEENKDDQDEDGE